MKLYSALKTGIKDQIWVSGVPENLDLPLRQGGKSALDNLFDEGMNYAQQYVDGERDNNVSVYPFCSTHFKCGMSVFNAPNGIIDRVYTIANDDWCDPVFYSPRDWPEPERWSRNLLTYEVPLNVGFPKLPRGFFFAESTTDAVVGRARTGIYSLFKKQIWLAPWIQSNEKVVVEWRGLKTEWRDDEPVNEAIEFRTYLKLFIQYAFERDYGDAGEAAKFKGLMDDALADLMRQGNIKTRRPVDIEYVDWRARTAAELKDDAVPDPQELTFAHIGNFGGASQATEKVVEMMRSFGPKFIVTGGDNVEAGAYDDEVGKFLHDFIYPYSGGYGDGAALNLLFPAPGDKDWDKNNLADYLAFFHLGDLVNERYYEFVMGDAHFFVLDSDSREPDGRTSSSTQGVWLQAKLALSTAAWKIVVLHHPPYSSGAVNGSVAVLHWPFKTWGADVVIAAHSATYERLSVGSLPYIVNGLGGMPIHAFGTPVSGSQVRYNDGYGAIIGKVSSERLLLEFYNPDRLLIDQLELT